MYLLQQIAYFTLNKFLSTNKGGAVVQSSPFTISPNNSTSPFPLLYVQVTIHDMPQVHPKLHTNRLMCDKFQKHLSASKSVICVPSWMRLLYLTRLSSMKFMAHNTLFKTPVVPLYTILILVFPALVTENKYGKISTRTTSTCIFFFTWSTFLSSHAWTSGYFSSLCGRRNLGGFPVN